MVWFTILVTEMLSLVTLLFHPRQYTSRKELIQCLVASNESIRENYLIGDFYLNSQ